MIFPPRGTSADSTLGTEGGYGEKPVIGPWLFVLFGIFPLIFHLILLVSATDVKETNQYYLVNFDTCFFVF